MSEKLIRATVPMCPKCEIVLTRLPRLFAAIWCPQCDALVGSPAYGYYDDSALREVVREVDREVVAWLKNEGSAWSMDGYDGDLETLVPIGTLRNWLHRWRRWETRLSAALADKAIVHPDNVDKLNELVNG